MDTKIPALPRRGALLRKVMALSLYIDLLFLYFGFRRRFLFHDLLFNSHLDEQCLKPVSEPARLIRARPGLVKV